MLYRCNFCGDLFNKRTHTSSIFEQVLCKKCVKILSKKQPTLGIGVIHYQEDPALLRQVLNSIDKQTFNFDNLKVVIVTDGGGYKISPTILNELKNIKPVCVYHNKNTKPGGCRNTAIELLDTDYIMFIDCDDVFTMNTLNYLFKKVLKHKPDIYCTTILEEYESGKQRKLNNIMSLNMTHGKVFKKDFLLRTGARFPENVRLGEDFKFMLQLYDVCDRIIFDTRRIVYKWQYNAKSITRTLDTDNNVDAFFRTLESTMTDLNDWFDRLPDKNLFVNTKLISLFYNIFYYKIMTAKISALEREKYLKQFFSLIKHPLDPVLLNQMGKHLNRKLMRNIEPFIQAQQDYQ